jgi:hypothetical protein
MITLTTLTSQARQKLQIEGENREQITLTLEYLPRSQSWNFSIEYLEQVINGIRLTNSPNVLRQFKNTLPFGIMCSTNDGLDPFFITDFESGRATISLLNEEEVQEVEETVYGSN